MDPLEAQIRQVFFFDTPDLALDKQRRRRPRPPHPGQGRRLGREAAARRPVRAARRTCAGRPGFSVEVDALPGRVRLLRDDEGRARPGRRHEGALAGERPLRKLFSKEQRAFFAAHAPDGLELDDLTVLGPIFVLKLRFTPKELDRRLVAEMWLYPDGSRVLELSTKCAPDEAFQVAAEAARVPRRARRRPLRRAADEDAQGARVLRARRADDADERR